MKRMETDVKSRREIADTLFSFHNSVNKAVAAAVETVMDRGDAANAVRLLKAAVGVAMIKMTKEVEAGQ